MGPALPERFARISVPGFTAEYTRLLPGTGPSTTVGHAIGVVFTPQRRAVWDIAGTTTRSGSLAAGLVLLVPAGGLEWREWQDVSESVEMWLDPMLLAELSLNAGGPATVALDYHETTDDPTIVSVASMVRQYLLMGGRSLEQVESLGILLGRHLLERYQGLRPSAGDRIRKLDRASLARVTEFINAHLDRGLKLIDLARIANRSPYHFAKAFKVATGASPHAYINARRMERALVLLQQTRLPVHRIAHLVGFQSLSHFRTRFRLTWGEPTTRYRSAGRPRAA
jgi:AraC family transcriptional regulator